ncbi:MAG: COG4315 family predicted lipoprotein [Solirubrobacterales bacterium]
MSLKRLSFATLALAALALIAVGCGGGSSSSSTSASAGPGSSGKSQTVSAAETPELGSVLVDSKGFAVYTFRKDHGTMSSCYGACAEAWPPVLVGGEPTVGEGANSSEVGTTKRKDGTTQLTYAGHPLYTFVEDKSPGEVNGNGAEAFGGVWNAVDENGTAPVASTGGGGGYGY